MSPEEFLGGGKATVTPADDFVGSGKFKVVEEGSTMKDLASGFEKGVRQVLFDVSAFNAGPVGKAMLANAPELKNTVDTVVKPSLEAKNPAQKVGKLAGELAVPLGPKAGATVVGEAAKRAGGAVEKVGNAAKAAGSKIYETGFNKTVQEAERQLSYEAQVPFLTRMKNALTGAADKSTPRYASDTAFEKGLAGTEKIIGVQAKREADTLWKEKIAPAVKNSPAVLTKDELLAPAEKLVAETTDPTRKKALQGALEALKEDYADATDWTVEIAQALKRDLDKFTPSKLFKGQDVTSEMRTLQHAMADGIRKFTYDALDDVNIKKDYLDWANLHQLEQIGVRAISEAKLKGGFGAFWSGIWDMATTPVKTIGGQVLYRVGNTFVFVGKNGIKKFGEFLAEHGFQKPSL